MKICMACMREYSESEAQCPFCGYSKSQMQQDIEDYPEALPPETILGGRFILGRILSLSDFSVIYYSWDALLCRRVAIREFFPYGLGERDPETGDICFETDQEKMLFEKGADVFEEEAVKLHENQDIDGIVHIYRIIRDHGTVYTVMEYLDGITLQDVLDEQGIESGSQGRNLVEGIARVIDTFHDRGICHYNLCPENIFIDHAGQIKITDFSGAKREIYRVLKRNVNLMDVRYAAPEVLSEADAGQKADLYSLGAIWYRIDKGKEPPQSRFLRREKRGLRVESSPSAERIEKLTMPNPNLRPVRAFE